MDEKAPTTHSASGGINHNYVNSLPSYFKIAQIVSGLLCWALIAAVYLHSFDIPAYQFVLFVSVTSWLLTIILYIIFLCGLNTTKLVMLPWAIIEFGFNAFWALFYFIAACVSAAYSGHHSHLIAATIFAFITTNVYIANANLAYKEWRGAYPWQQPSTGTNVST